MNNYEILKEYEEHKTPVPSYEDWKDLKLHDEKATIKLGEKIIENNKLKELLRNCNEYLMNRDVIFKRNSQYLKLAGQYHYILTKIDEVLK